MITKWYGSNDTSYQQKQGIESANNQGGFLFAPKVSSFRCRPNVYDYVEVPSPKKGIPNSTQRLLTLFDAGVKIGVLVQQKQAALDTHKLAKFWKCSFDQLTSYSYDQRKIPNPEANDNICN